MTAVIVRWLGRRPYLPVWHAMQRFTANRTAESTDEIWLLEHEPVYTTGVRGRPDRDSIDGIPLIRCDRGGLTTYHGPGQLVVYPLLDLARRPLSVRGLVTTLERSVIELLRQYGIRAEARPDAPGVYVERAKIASVGIRVRRLCSYHGLSLNIDGDLSPFAAIDPCGFSGMPMTRLADLGADVRPHEAAVPLLGCLMAQLGYDRIAACHRQLPDQSIDHEQSA